MQEKTILNVSLAIIILGLVFLFFYAEEIDLAGVSSLDSLPTEETVKVKGIIRKVNDYDKVTFLKLEAERIENMDVILFKSNNLFLKEGDYVEIEGTAEEYQGKKEVIANKVTIK